MQQARQEDGAAPLGSPAPEGGPGGRPALDGLVPEVYDEMRAIARRLLRRQRPGHTFDTTALVHEAYLKLAGRARVHGLSHDHVLALAARVMRHILIDHARRHRASKRAGGYAHVSLGGVLEHPAGAGASADERADVLLALDGALTHLAALDERLCRVVECRFFAGLTEGETASALGVTVRTVQRDWVKAKAWLHGALRL